MNPERRTRLWALIAVAVSAVLANAQTPPKTRLPEEVRRLVATAKGRWTSYGLNAEGKIVKRFEYPDELSTKDLKVEGGRAFVTYTAELRFPGQQDPFILEGKEGYYLNEDGSVGDYFTEQFGQITRYKRLSDGVWAGSTPAFPQELQQLGFSNVIAGTHVLIKVIAKEKSIETHSISRVTTVHWKDAAGEERWIQFTSLQGQHEVVPSGGAK